MRAAITILLTSLALGAQDRDLRVVDARAGSHAMAGEYAKAIRLLEDTLAAPGGDPSLRLALRLKLARNQSYDGRARAAIRNYETYLAGRPGDRAAAIELVRLRRYRGDYSRAEKLCNRLLEANPNDAQVLALKAEVLHWAGQRSREARREANRAVSLAADSPDAKVAHIYALRDLGQRRQARREFGLLAAEVSRSGGPGPESTYRDAYRLLEEDLERTAHVAATPAYSNYNDSDGIHNNLWGLRLAAPFRDDHQFRFDLSAHRSSAPASELFTAGRAISGAAQFAAGGSFRAAPGVDVTLLGGGYRRQSAGGVQPIFDFRIAATPIDRWTFHFSSARDFLKVTPRAIDRDVSSYKIAGGAQYAFDSRASLEVRAERRYWSDGNRGIAGDAVFRRILQYYKSIMIDGGVLEHWEQYARDTKFASGFFTPNQYFRHDGFLGLRGEFGRRASYEVRGAAGAQRVARAAGYRPDWEVAAAATFRLHRSLGLSANYMRRNYSLLSRDGWYQGFHVNLRFEQ